MTTATTLPPFGDPRISYKLTAAEPVDEQGNYGPIEWEGDPNSEEGRFVDDSAYLFIDGKLVYEYRYRNWADWGGEVSERQVYDAYVRNLESTNDE